MPTTASVNWGRVAREALAAGLVAGITIELALWLTTMLPAGTSIVSSWQWIASVALGDAAATGPGAAVLGVVLHFAVAIGWAGGFAYLAQQQPFVARRWVIGGLVYGLVVMLFMDILLIGAHKFVLPATGSIWLAEILAHTVFFGLPLAFVIHRFED